MLGVIDHPGLCMLTPSRMDPSGVGLSVRNDICTLEGCDSNSCCWRDKRFVTPYLHTMNMLVT